MNRTGKVEKLKVVLQYMPAAICFITALSLWRSGNNASAVLFGVIGIGLMLLAVLLNTIRKIMGNDRHFTIVLAILVFSCSLYSWINGEIYYGLILTLVSLFMIANHFFYSQKGTGSKWSTPMWQIYLPIVVGLITFVPLLYLQYKKNNTHIEGSAVGTQRENIERSFRPNQVSKEKTSVASLASPMQKMVEIMNRSFPPEQRETPAFQKMMAIIASESFQEQAKQQKPKSPEEILQLLAAHGLAEAAEIDFDKLLAEGHQRLENAYKARNPGKDPAAEEDVMANRLVESMKKHGATRGMTNFVMNPDNATWIAVRFKDDREAYDVWMDQVIFRAEKGLVSRSAPTSELSNGASTSPAPTNIDFPNSMQEDIPASEKTSPDSFVELEDSTIPDIDLRGSDPSVEPLKVAPQVVPAAPALPIEEDIKTTLSEQFSSERFDRAMSTLERYGAEEGLRRLRENDPEVAERIDRQRNREDRESDESRSGEDY